MIQVARPYFRFKENILKAIGHTLESGRLMNGENTKAFETEFAQYCGSKFAISANSCTSALEIALRFFGVSDHEVIIPANTFIASGNSVLFAGGLPVLADIKDGTYNIDIDEIKKNISKKTKGVIVVHIAGIICEEINEILDLCHEKNLFLLEDCAHAPGATLHGKKAGTFGDAGCFSFYPTKIMTTGTGGMITTNSESLDTFARSARVHGSSPKGTSEIINMGNDWFMDEIRSAIGLYQLRDLDNLLQVRRDIAKKYTKKIESMDGVSVLPINSQSIPAYYKYPAQLDKKFNTFDFKQKYLEKYKIELESLYWPPCHLQPLYQQMFKFREGYFPIAEKILKQQICLPIHALITEEDIDFVIQGLEALL